MFETIKPPTDNLYKFIALAGLALLIASLWKLAPSEVERLRVSNRLAELDRQKSREEREAMTDYFQHSLAEGPLIYVDDEHRRQLERESKANHEAWSKEYDAKNQRIHEKYTSRIAKLSADLKRLPREDDPERSALLAGATSGVFLMIAGFATWYWRVQKPLDQILQMELKELERKLTE